MPKKVEPPPAARKVPGLKLWVTEDGQPFGPYGPKKVKVVKGSPAVTVTTDEGRKSMMTLAKAVARTWVEPFSGRSLAFQDGDRANVAASNVEWIQTRKDRQRRWEIRMALEMEKDPRHPLHGTPTGYNIGCRCGKCKAAEKLEHMRRVTRKTIREVEALCGTTAP